MNTPHRSLPASLKGNTKDSLLIGFNSNRSSKHSRQSLGSVNTKQADHRSSLQTDMHHKRNKNKKSVRLSQLMAAMYPGMKIGHKYCVPTMTMVPQTMGWLWNTEETIAGVPFPRGWRPGAIALGVKKRFTRPHSIDEPLTTPIGSKGKKPKLKRMKATSSTILKSRTASMASTHEKSLPPTLYVHKEKGVYRVTMQPIKNLGTTNANEEEEKPIQFKVAEDSASSHSWTSKSSSTIKIEYLCTGARRKPIVKPELAEVSTQWEILQVKEPETQQKEENKEASQKGKKKGMKGKSSKDETKTDGPIGEGGDQKGDKTNINEKIEDKDVKDIKRNKTNKK